MRGLLAALALAASLGTMLVGRAAGCQQEHWFLEHYARVTVTCAGHEHGLIVIWR